MAVRLELRYRGLRAPHKIKLAVSGCARECAEAQSKDVGVVATEKGWNLYVCGNGGMHPRHADLLASDVDSDTLIRYIDRFLMYYVRTAGRLERTATWVNKLDGGIEQVRRVVVKDALGLGGELEAAMAAHVAGYRCEWTETLADPHRVARFRTFVNGDAPASCESWIDVCGIDDVTPDRGVAARVDGAAVAVFVLGDGQVFAVDDRDPWSGADVVSRGIVGSIGERVVVASPMYKQHIDLATGQGIEHPDVTVRTWPARVVEGRVQVARA